MNRIVLGLVMFLRSFINKGYLTVLTLIVSQSLMAKQWCPPGQQMSYDTAADAIILEYHVTESLIASPDPTPFLQIKGDGTVNVHYPHYMLKAGDYSYQLTPQELKALLRELEANCLFQYNRNQVKQQITSINQQQEVVVGQTQLHYRSDRQRNTILVNLSSYTPATQEEGQVLLRRNIMTNEGELHAEAVMENAEFTASQYPSIPEVQGFADSVQRLREIVTSPKLIKVQK